MIRENPNGFFVKNIPVEEKKNEENEKKNTTTTINEIELRNKKSNAMRRKEETGYALGI